LNNNLFLSLLSHSSDGWEISLVSFTIPNAESSGADSALYGVSLFFQRTSADDIVIYEGVSTDFVLEEENANAGNQKEGDASTAFTSPITFNTPDKPVAETPADDSETKDTIRRVKVSTAIPIFNEKLQEKPWVERAQHDEHRDQSKPITVGLALVARRNTILAMRDALSKLLFDYSKDPSKESGGSSSITCGALVEVLGNFSYRDVESSSLRCILEPYLRAASSPWIDRPIATQEQAFETRALRQLSDCLPPTPLALMFVTALLEQKIVLSSSRRSVLHSATAALAALLKPLEWSHLLVAMVPASLASDLIQYPAPFILGVPSEESDNTDLLGNLPRDVTLVDLDVGRVILAPLCGHDNEMVLRSEDPEATAKALRSQVLFLAQALGSVFGNSLRPDTWGCDSPSQSQSSIDESGIDNLRSSAQSFVHELLEGVASCSYWIEEATQSYGVTVEPTVLFDEDKFFEIKNHRATKACKHLFPKCKQGELALSLDTFDLFLESFLRCQSMSSYISSRPKTEMAYY
jgi:hypothetical protein